MIEILGTVATLVILASFIVSGERKIRIINILGALLFVVYGYKLHAPSVYILNGVLCIVHIYKLLKESRRKLC